MARRTTRRAARGPVAASPAPSAASPAAKSQTARAAGDRWRLVALLVLLLAIGLAYAPVARHEFVNFDDNLYVTENRHVLAGITFEGLRWAATSLEYSNWHPLTWISHMLDVQFFGQRPGPHHLVNVVLHAANALLLLHLFRGMTGAFWRPLIVAALFALHPLRVESVAWVSERKDVLSTLLMLCTLLAYRRHARSPGPRSVALVTALFALGLTAKPMLVTLPFVLLLLDYWPLGRFAGGPVPAVAAVGGPRTSVALLVLEKTPLFALSLASSVVTYVAQRGGGSMSLEDRRFLGNRVSQTLVSYVDYLDITLWPSGLSFFYPRAITLPGREVAAATVVLVAIIAAVLLRVRAQPYLAVGWFWFAGTLVPVSGIVQVGSQAMADRYTYIPHIGLFIALVWLLGDLAGDRRALHLASAGAATAVAAVCTLLSLRQVETWRDTETLMRRALTIEGGNWLAEVNVGSILERQGRTEEAEAHFRNALRLNPLSPQAHYNLATNLGRKGRYVEAVEQFRVTLEIQPNSPLPLNNLALSLSALGRHEEAVASMEQALLLEPGDAKKHSNLGMVLDAAGRREEAERAYRNALRIDDTLVSIHNNFGILLARQGRLREAVEHFATAVRLDPTDRAARDNLARALARQGSSR